MASSGMSVAAASSGFDAARAIAIQADGRIVVAGTASGSSGKRDFAVLRFNANGSLDAAFASGGVATVGLGPLEDLGKSVALQSDGKIVVAGDVRLPGFSIFSDNDFGAIRLNANGTLDTGFSGDGKVTTNFGLRDFVNDVQVGSDGRVILVGTVLQGALGLVSYASNGALDATFNATGPVPGTVATLVGDPVFGGSGQSARILSGGQIIVVGTANSVDPLTSAPESNLFLARYNADGTLDAGFGVGGIVTTVLTAGNDGAESLAVQSDGKFVVAGFRSSGTLTSDFVVVRYNANGTLDTSFGTSGVTSVGTGSATSVRIQSDGKLLLAGRLQNGAAYEGAVVRLNPNGSLDSTFSVGGKAMISAVDSISALAVQADGRILVTGARDNGVDTDVFLARLTPGGSLDAGFGGLVRNGTAGADTLAGSSMSDLIDGGGGADVMRGGDGGDTFFVDDAADVVLEGALGRGRDLVVSSVSYTLRSGVEDLSLSGGTDISGTGNSAGNRIVGNVGANLINGQGGDDTMVGGAGNDTYVVDQAGDIVTERAGEGIDTVRSSVSYVLGDEVEKLILLGSGSVNGTGNALANVLTGNGGANVLSGGLGRDTIAGKGGADTLIGGAGGDTFVFDTALGPDNVDLIQSFSPGIDKIRLDASVFSALVPGVSPNFTAGALAASPGIVYDPSSGSLFYDADGPGGAAQVLFARVGAGAVHPTLTAADFTVVA